MLQASFPSRTLLPLVIIIVVLTTAATLLGIFSNDGHGSSAFTSVQGTRVMLYGKGLYKHMSVESAPQGIAQDYVTLFIGIPLLIISFLLAQKGSLRGKIMFTGTCGYLLVSYLFYTVMAMYNAMFLAYVVLMGSSFFSFIITLLSFRGENLQYSFSQSTPIKPTGGFLIFIAAAIALLWLSIVLPPLFNGTIIPQQVEHYTTLVVQGLDLGILLPSAFLSGLLFRQKKPLGYLLAPVYFVFLSILMTALTAKVIAIKMLGYSVVPVIFIIPTFTIITIACSISILKSTKES